MNKVLSIASAACIAGLFLAPFAFAAPLPVTAEGRDYFEAHIRPVLVAECYECHAGDKSKGGLLLDSRDALRKGGDNGPGLIPGDATGSLLIQSLAHTHADVDLHMPKNGAKLDETTLRHFIAWVNMGAPDPRDQPSKVEGAQGVSWDQVFALRRQWWSLQPLQRPAVSSTEASKNPVDAFILAKLSEQGLHMSPEADRRLLIRRLSYALTGLPPKPEEIERFLADTSPQAWSSLIDHYLALPSYGETWARHWMDLMRYAESHGSEGDPTIPEAWRYRDYLTRAFNADLPYDQFVKEHVAGDLLKPRWNDDLGINESLLATANLRLVEHGFQPVDSLDEQVKMVDNQVDVFSKSFLGLTVSCARCHDHKFDAISQKDFFGLYGIFASTRPAQVVLDKPERLDIHRDELQKLKGEIKSELARLWLTAAEGLPDQLLKGGANGGGSAWRAKVEREIDELRSQARAQALASKGGASVEKSVPQPTACWNFEGDVQDSVGQLHGELMGAAAVRNGKLVLNGEDAFVQTASLTRSISARTLEAWVKLATTDQRGGGVVSIETERGEIFDSIVFGEKRPMEWLSGSNNHRRTRDSGGPPEPSAQTQFTHVAIVYAPDNSVTVYRNGEVYGSPYVPEEELQTYLAGSGHILLGKRHLGGGSALLKGEIEEARLYDRALSASELAASFKAGAVAVTEKDLVAAMTDGQRRKFEELNTALKNADAAAKADPTAENWAKALGTAGKDGADALSAWSRLRNRTGAAFAKGWSDLVTGWTQDLESRRSYNTANFTVLWDLASGEDYKKWFKEGNGLPLQPAAPGEFVVEPEGNVVVQHLLPAGVYSPLFSSKHAALLTSPYFKMDTDAMSFQLTGDDGGGVRVIVDNYPLGNNNTYPQFRPGGDPLRWFKLDTTYRKGSR
ncbi:MAG TPA: DUF1549 domain-containing protein, partial [Verrucomicrobium sp.]|nr:DUF1549 domain-containing protein [Verrucomicrobium sp.]